ncbi:MAG TPA: metallophosphoesterase family protein [Gaiellaceae bacterium]|nr:metallophosphoesterase family protein [Gaiellaceae bacterium]
MIALLGDTHMPRGSRALPDGCLRVLEAADLILHTGDLTGDSVLALLEAYAPVRAVQGNMDEWPVRERLPGRVTVEAEGLRIGLVHDAGPAAGRHARLRAWFPACEIVAYGHTHQPEIARDGEVWIVNPGSPTERRRAPGHTMAVVRDGIPQLVSLD